MGQQLLNTPYTFAPMAVATNSLAAGVTAAGPWVPTSQPTDGLSHLVTIKNNTANSHAGKTLTIVGTDADGKAQTETGITGPAGSATVTSTKYFATVASVTPSATIGADTFDLGLAAGIKSKSYPLNAAAAIGASFFPQQTGTSTWSIELCPADPNPAASQAAVPWVAAPAGLTSQTGTGTAITATAAGYGAWRWSQASQTGTPSVTVYVAQPASG
jgi:hypothetical protein